MRNNLADKANLSGSAAKPGAVMRIINGAAKMPKMVIQNNTNANKPAT